jgi:hypothetical protein
MKMSKLRVPAYADPMILTASGNSESRVALTVDPARDPPGIIAVPSLVAPLGS